MDEVLLAPNVLGPFKQHVDVCLVGGRLPSEPCGAGNVPHNRALLRDESAQIFVRVQRHLPERGICLILLDVTREVHDAVVRRLSQLQQQAGNLAEAPKEEIVQFGALDAAAGAARPVRDPHSRMICAERHARTPENCIP